VTSRSYAALLLLALGAVTSPAPAQTFTPKLRENLLLLNYMVSDCPNAQQILHVPEAVKTIQVPAFTCPDGSTISGSIQIDVPSQQLKGTLDAGGKTLTLDAPVKTKLKIDLVWRTSSISGAPYNNRLAVQTTFGDQSDPNQTCTGIDPKNGLSGAQTSFSATAECTFAKIGYGIVTAEEADPVLGVPAGPTSFFTSTSRLDVRATMDDIATFSGSPFQLAMVSYFNVLNMDEKYAMAPSQLEININGASSDGGVPTLAFLKNGTRDPDLAISNIRQLEPGKLKANLDVALGATPGPRTLEITPAAPGAQKQTLDNALNVLDTHLELSQGTRFEPDLQRIANHPTVVRAFLKNNSPTAAPTGLTGLLYVFKEDGSQITGSPFSATVPGNRPPLDNLLDVRNAYTNDDKFFLRDSLNFYFSEPALVPGAASSLPAGTYTLAFAIDPKDPTKAPARVTGVSHDSLKTRRDFNLLDEPRTYPFASTRSFKILTLFDKRLADKAKTALKSTLHLAQEYLRAAYPVDGTRIVYSEQQTDINVDDFQTQRLTGSWGKRVNGYLSWLLAFVNRNAAESGGETYDRLLFVTNSGSAFQMLGNGTTGLANTDTFDTAVVSGDVTGTIAHEIGHTFGLGETYCGFGCSNYIFNVYSTCYTARVNCVRDDAISEGETKGNRVEDGAVRLFHLVGSPAYTGIGASASVAASGGPSGFTLRFQRIDLMGGTNEDNDRWPDLLEWNYLYGKLRAGSFEREPMSVPDPLAGELLTVRGVVTTADAVTLISVLKTTIAAPTSADGSDYVLELLDGAGAVLSSKGFAVSFVQPDVGLTTEAGFVVAAPFPAGATQFRIRHGSKALVTRALSASPPTVQVTAPTGGTVSGTTTISWTANDPDGNALTYSLYYLRDGTNPAPIVVNLTATSYSWNTAGYGGGASARILVVATDGTFETKARSNPFNVAKGTPTVAFLSPTDGSALPAATDVTLSGGGSDPEDGSLPAGALSFRSSRDGNLGTGNTVKVRLSEGAHALTLRGVDVDGNASEASINVTVGNAANVPVLGAVVPQSAPAGSDVTLFGAHLDLSGRTVRFGDLTATVKSGTASQLVVTVPAVAPAGPTTITVTAGGFTTQPVSFTVTYGKPHLDALDPASGPPGTPVILRGTEFDPNATANTVTFGSAAATVLSGSATGLVVSVPQLGAGTVNVTVSSSRGASNALPFQVTTGTPATPVQLTSLSPSSGPTGTTITIQGSGFSSNKDQDFVLIGGRQATVGTATATTLTVTVPAGLPNGAAAVVVTVNGFPSNPLTFTVGGSTSAPRLTVSASSLDFGSVAPGQSADRTLTLTNSGTAALSVSSLTSSNARFSVVSPATPINLAVNGSQPVTLRFSPTASGAQSGTLTIASNDPASPATVSLSGTGTSSGGGGTEELKTDDGSAEVVTADDFLMMVNRLTPSTYPATLQKVRIYAQELAGSPSPVGSYIYLVAFTDPAGAGQPPANPNYVFEADVPVPSFPASGGFIDFDVEQLSALSRRAPLAAPTLASGDFYVGYEMFFVEDGTGFLCDSSGPQQGRAFYSYDDGFTFQKLGGLSVRGQVVPVNPMIRAVVSGGSLPANSLLLADRKVSVTATWKSQYTGQGGQAIPSPQKNEFGFFYFDNPNNPELFVKVLNFGSTYAIFFAALTDYELHVTFTALATGQSITFDKAPGPPSGDNDSTRLKTSSGREPLVAPTAPSGEVLRTKVAPRLLTNPAAEAAEPLAAANDLMLSSGRVKVQVTWKSQYSGQGGSALVIPQKDEYGYFYFTDPNNPEIFVKVLDFGAKYAVLAAGLTDYEFHVTFTVLRTGQTLTFDRPAGGKNGFADSTTLVK